jgi:hypothetical protein
MAHKSNSLSAAAIRLFRVYSPLRPALVVRLFASSSDEAVSLATQQKPRLARIGGARAFPA